MQVKLSLQTWSNGTPGSSFDGSNTTAASPREALTALLREAADQLDADQFDSIDFAGCAIKIQP